jgi:hypothetical protein
LEGKVKKVIDSKTATTVQEMLDVLLSLMDQMHHAAYITINSGSVRLTLVEETLTDGSKVYNVELTEVSK